MQPVKLLLGILSLALATGAVDAQPSHRSHWSLEARIAEAEAVVLGPIVKVHRKVLVAPGNQYPDGQHEQAPAIKIEEVLKGKLQGVVDDLHPRWSTSPDVTYDQWMKAGNKVLWFLGPAPEPGKKRRWHAVVFGKTVPHEAFYGGRREPPMYAMDFTLLKDEAAILAHARQYAKTSTKILRTDTIRFGPPWNDLIVPVEPALEPLAKRLIASPQDFAEKNAALEPRERYQFRYSGVRLLRHFKSDDNIKLLTSLLEDPLEKFESSLVMQHPVRVKAFEVLLHWNVDAPLPAAPGTVSRVDLTGTAVTDAGLKRVAQLTNLEWLQLSRTGITAVGLQELAGLKKLQQLEMGPRQMSDAVLRTLRKIDLLHTVSLAGDRERKSPADVSSFTLWKSPVTDAGLKELADFTNLTYLDLRDTRVTDAGLKELVGFKKLTALFLQGTQVTVAGVAELQKALPNCKIHRVDAKAASGI